MSVIVAYKRRILALTPQWVRRAVSSRREAIRLGALPKATLDTQGLGYTTAAELDAAMRGPELAEQWRAASSRIDALNIVAFAGGVNLGDRRALFSLVVERRPRTVLEIGTHIGASTAAIAAAMAAVRSRPAGHPEITTVDIIDVNDPVSRPWASNGSSMSPRQVLARLGLEDRVEFVAQGSLDYLQYTENRFNLIFLDGGHSAATVYREIPAALRCLNPGGLILLHDYYPCGQPIWSNGTTVHGPWMAIERLRSEGAPIQVVPFGELPWETKLNSKCSSLALLVSAAAAGHLA